jgi:hypothetical protein
VENTFEMVGYQGFVVYSDIEADAETEESIVMGRLEGKVREAKIRNLFERNTLTGYGGGYYFDSEITADLDPDESDIGGNVTALIGGSLIENTISRNTVTDGYGGFVLSSIGPEEGFDGDDPMIDAEDVEVDGILFAKVSESSINNQLTANTLMGGYGGLMASFVGAEIYVDGAEYDDLQAFVNLAGITNTFSRNTFSDTDEGPGLFMFNEIRASYDECCSEASIMNSSISDRFTNDRFTDNDGDGVEIFYSTYANDTEDVAIDLFMQGVTATENDGAGVDINYEGDGTFTGDLGGGALGSNGMNSFFGNSDADVENDSGTEIKAENNWWGDSDPSDQVDGDPVDFDPWLNSAP